MTYSPFPLAPPTNQEMGVWRRCRLAAPALGLILLTIVASGLVTAQTSDPANRETPQKVALISGHVYRADTHQPIAKAKVTLNTPIASSNGQYQTVETGKDGAFAFFDLRPATGTFIPQASAEGFVNQDYSLDGTLNGKFLRLTPGVTFQSVDFYLPVAGVISGSVSDEHGTRLKHIEVTAVRRKFLIDGQERPSYVQATATDADGNFQLKGLLPGSYLIVANGPYGNSIPGNAYRETYYPNEPSLTTAKAVMVGANAETRDIHIAIKAEKRYTITGKVSGPGPPDGVARYLYTIHLEGRNGTLSMKDDGSFTMPDVPAGDYTMVAFATEMASHQNAGLSKTPLHVADADTNINVVVGGVGEISGRVVGLSSMQSLTGLRLLIRSTDAANGSTFDENGHFDVTRVLPGSYSFDLAKKDQRIYLKQFRCSGRDYTFEAMTVAPEQVVSDCEVTLGDDGGTIKGDISDGGKSVAPALTAVLIPESIKLRKLARYTTTTKVGSDGLFTIDNVIPEDYLLFVLPSSEEQPYFAPGFVDQHRAEGLPVKITAHETKTIVFRK